jgi:hypothetical protein
MVFLIFWDILMLVCEQFCYKQCLSSSFYIIVALPDDDRNHWLERVVNVLNKWIQNHFLCCIDRIKNKQALIEQLQLDEIVPLKKFLI